LLRDGRFAFLIAREEKDLRSYIDSVMKLKTNQNSGPFSKVQTERIIWNVAKGMDWLHSCNIVHRDLKASNVLMGKGFIESRGTIYVADFECSIGVIGTGFFRAPEILQACKDRTINCRP
jgi:serine/threonine protein kinase